MEKRYQVFVSSTYADLKEERRNVLQTLMEMDCIPAGMELFPAANLEQFEFIKRVIDDCDYYLLIIGGRYGSLSNEGISYTEKEFDYAVEKGLDVIALIHGSPEEIPIGKSEINEELREKLNQFKEKVKTNRLVKFWNNADELQGLVAVNMLSTIKRSPAIGWVRANNLANEEALRELNSLRKQNDQLQELISTLRTEQTPTFEELADFDSLTKIEGSYSKGYGSQTRMISFVSTISWKELFTLISPYLIEQPSDGYIRMKLASILQSRETNDTTSHDININEQTYKTISIQLKAYGLINLSYSKTTKGDMALFWSLTRKGEKVMMENRIIKKNI